MCTHAPKCPISDGPCEKECCGSGVCYTHVKPMQPSISKFTDGIGCPGSTVTLDGVLCNGGPCDRSFDLTYQDSGTAIIASIAGPPGLSLAGDSCQGFAVIVTIDPASPPGTATNTTDENCDGTLSKSTSATATVTVFNVDITTPNADPATTAGANSSNERTYDTIATDPTVTIPCAAASVPDPNKLRWTVNDVGTIRATWSPSVPGDAYTGTGSSPTATFTGMPANNNDFGPKTITVTVDGFSGCHNTQVVEIFFPKNATNHPAGQTGSPNWFHYWGEALSALGTASVIYHNVAGLNGVTPAGFYWSPTMMYSKMEIWICDHSALFNTSPYNPGTRWGIDAMADTILHENGHVVQITQADALVPTGTGIWVQGWSWKTGFPSPLYNHYTAGPDGVPGVAGMDDDGDGTIDESGDNSEYGFGDDVDLDIDHDEIPNTYEGLNPPWLEPACQNLEQTTDNDHAASDWGDPGKRHNTNNLYND